MNNQKVIALLIFMLSLSAIALAQPPAGGGSGSTPIDGGLGLLIGGIAAYGVKKIRDSRRS